MGWNIDGTRVVRVSHDRKTGPVSATYRRVGPTCPDSCGLLRDANGDAGGCYALRGRVALHARRTGSDHVGNLDDAAGMDLLRHMVSGDWFRQWGSFKRLDVAYVRNVIAWHVSQPRTQGWSYTHDFDAWDRARVGPASGLWPSNFLVLASCDTAEQRDRAKKAGWQTARVVEDDDQLADGECYCPYDKTKHSQKGGTKSTPSVTCRTCRLCWEPAGDGLQKDIAFLKH